MLITKDDLRLVSKEDLAAFIQIQEAINHSRTDSVSKNESVLVMAKEVYKEL